MMNDLILSLPDVKLIEKEELRAIVFKKYWEQDVWELPFVSCMVSDACGLLEQGHIIKMDPVIDWPNMNIRCTDIMWVLEFENNDAIYYILLKCSTEPSEEDMTYGYSHITFEKYDFEIFYKYI